MDINNSTCPHCFKKFFNCATKKRHIKSIHKVTVEIKQKNNRIFCPRCPSDGNRKGMQTYVLFHRHLKDKHDVTVEEERLTFPSHEDFEKWRQLEYRNVDYIIANTENNKILYYCNRSNYYGHESKCSKRYEKKGGSIKIDGVCPARINVKFHWDGHVEVHYVKTHVGHEEEVRTRRLTHEEQKEFADKIRAGVSLDRILEDTKRIQNGKVERKNLILRNDLKYIIKKFNIEISRDPNDMVAATAIKVQEWNSDNKNCSFIFKEIGAEMENEESDHFCIEEMSEEKLNLKEAENEVLYEKYQELNNKENHEENIDDETRKSIIIQDFINKLEHLKNMDITTVKKAIDKMTTILNQFLPNTSTKRKMEEQNYSQTQKKQSKN